MTDDVEIRSLLASAAQLVAEARVSLRVDTDTLETVFVEVDGGEIVVTDRGTTFLYLVTGGPQSGDATVTEWSLETALRAVRDLDVEIVGDSDEDEASFEIRAVAGPSTTVAAVVARMSRAVDAVFAAHTRADLR